MPSTHWNLPRRAEGVLRLLLVAGLAGSAASQEPSALDLLLKEGVQLNEKGQWAAAKTRFEAALFLARETGTKGAEAEAHRGLGWAAIGEARYADAEKELELARGSFAEVGDERGLARVHNHLASLAWYRNDLAQARGLYLRALEQFRAIGDVDGQVLVLGNLPFVGETQEEREAFVEQALAVVRAGKNREATLALLLHVRGDLLRNRAEYAMALASLQESAALYEAFGNRPKLASVYTSLGALYREHGLLDRAESFHRRALDLREKAGDRFGVVQSLTAVAIALREQGQPREALAVLEKANAACAEIGSSTMLLIPLWHTLADIHQQLGNPARAHQIARDLLPIIPDERIPGIRAKLAETAMALGRSDEAFAHLEIAEAAARSSKLPLHLVWVLGSKTEICSRAGRPAEALAAATEAIDLIEQLRPSQARADSLKLGFLERWQSSYAVAVRLMSDAGRIQDAFEMAERGRARAFLDLLAKPSSAASRIPSSELESPSLAAALSYDEAVEQARRLGTTLLSYFVTDRETFVWTIRPDHPVDLKRLPVSSRKLQQLVDRASTSLAGDRSPRGLPTRGGGLMLLGASERTAWRELHDLVVRPVEALLPRDPEARITIVPHGPLFGVPFGALVDGEGRYWIERHTLSYAPAAGIYRFTGAHTLTRTDLFRSPAFVGDPEAGLKDLQGRALPDLPGTRYEAFTSARLVEAAGLGPARVLVGEEADEASVLQAAGEASLLHFATHGIVDDERPADSFLALSPRGAEPDRDGRLTLDEIYSLRLKAGLVVLSACRTGRGRPSADGMVGLTRGFFHAGAPSILATLWDVADQPTFRLMTDFYRGLGDGLDKDRALRRSQLKLIKELRAGDLRVPLGASSVALPEHPSFWAGFVLLGEP